MEEAIRLDRGARWRRTIDNPKTSAYVKLWKLSRVLRYNAVYNASALIGCREGPNHGCTLPNGA